MITYKNLRDVTEIQEDIGSGTIGSYYKTIIKAKVDLYEVGGILRWYKPTFVKTINVIKVWNTWRDLDNEHLPLDSANIIEELYCRYVGEKNIEDYEKMIVEEIQKYK